MTDPTSTTTIPKYSVSVWEGILIMLGAIALTVTGLAGLSFKVLSNAFDPVRAEAIAKSLMDYKIPGGSQGLFGINIGSAKLAWVRSTTSPPDVILFVGKTPINKESDQEAQQELRQDFEHPPSEDANQEFILIKSRTENRLFCGKTVSVTIETGQQTLSDLSAPTPASRYTASLIEGTVEQLVILTTNGDDAEAKAEAIFKSLECKPTATSRR